MLSVRLFGPVDIRVDGEPLLGFESRKALSLLCLLAHSGEPWRRDLLAERFWGDRGLARARGNLSRVLSTLGRLLPGRIHADRWSIAFERGGDCWVDTVEFALLAASPILADQLKAAELARGELMQDLDLEDCEDHQLWLLSEREVLGRRQRHVIHRVVGGLSAEGRPEEALRWADRLVALAPWHEEGQRDLIRLLARMGERAAALAQFERCRRALRDELGIEPAPETLALAEALRVGKFAAIDPTRLGPAPLPSALTSFLGRERELEQAIRRIEDPGCRLLSILGPGGVGKTRLAIEVARRLAYRFPDGVAFLRMDATPGAARLASALVEGLRLAVGEERSPEGWLAAWLAPRSLLLVLDGFENLLPAAPDLTELLARSPGLKLLVTTQAPLRLQPEWVLTLTGLPVEPEIDAPGEPPAPAQRLFLERARQHRPGFWLDALNAPLVDRICRGLEGMPLGIELAAAQLARGDCSSIAESIERGVSAFEADLIDVPARQRSLAAVFEESWRHLDPGQRRLLAGLTVFRGGWSPEAVLRVLGPEAPALAELESRGLLLAGQGGRGRLHSTLLRFARSRLGDDEAPLRRRHARWCLELATQAERELGGPGQAEWLVRLAHEHDNLRAAMDWLAHTGQPQQAGRIATSVWRFWLYRGHWEEGLTRVERLVEALGAEPPSRVSGLLHNVGGVLADRLGQTGRATRHLEAALEIWRWLERPADLANTLNNLGVLADEAGDVELASSRYAHSLAIRRELGRSADIATSLNNLAVVASRMGQLGRAHALLEEGLALKRELGDRHAVAMSLANLAELARRESNLAGARDALSEGFEIAAALEEPALALELAFQLVPLCAALGRPAMALTLAVAQERLRAQLGSPISAADLPDYEATLASLRGALGEAEAEQARAAGSDLDVAGLAAFGLRLCAELVRGPAAP